MSCTDYYSPETSTPCPSIPGYWTYAAVIIVMRIAGTYANIITRKRLAEKRKENPNIHPKRRRFPLGGVANMFTTCAIILSLILAGTGVTNGPSGTTFVLLGPILASNFLGGVFFVIKVIHVNERNPGVGYSYVSRILLVLCIPGLVTATITSLMAASPVVFPDGPTLAVKIFFAGHLSFGALAMSAIIWSCESTVRIINANVSVLHANIGTGGAVAGGGGGTTSSTAVVKMQRSIFHLRRLIINMTFGLFVSLAVDIPLAVGILPFRWYVAESCFFMLSFLDLVPFLSIWVDRKVITQRTLLSTAVHNGIRTNKAAEDKTFSIMDDGQVANIDGATISVVQHEIVDVDINDTFMPKAANMALRMSRYLVRTSVRYTFIFATAETLVALLVVALTTDQIAAAIVFLIVVTFGCFALLLTTLSKKVLVELWHTDFLRFRIVVTLMGVGLLADALGGTSDARSMVAPALGMLQLVAFCTDALVTPLFRSSIIWCASQTTFITWVFIFWDLLPNVRNTVIPIGSGYSLLQASRDILLAQGTLFLVEGRFVSRGRNNKRFLHVTRTVEKILLSCAETQSRETVRQHKRMGNASSVMMQSGFVLHQASQTSLQAGERKNSTSRSQEERTIASDMDGESPIPHKARVRVYVNKVAVKQASAILFAVFGFEEYAIIAYSYLDGLTGRVMHAAALLLPLVTAILLPFVPKSVSYPLCWACVPCTVIISFWQLLLLSTTMTKLLVARVTFLPVVGLMLGWMILMCVVLGGDARCAVATFGALTYVWCDVSGDASTATSARLRVVRALTAMGASPTILVLSIYFLTDQFVDVSNVDWSVKALGETNSTQSNAPEVIDASQLVGDFGFFSIAIPTILQAIQVMLTFFKQSDGKTNFDSIAAPVMPNYVQEGVKDEVTIATTSLPVTDGAASNDQPSPPIRPISIAMSQSHRSYRSQDELKKHISLVVKRMESTFVANETTADGVGDPRTMVQVDIEPEIIW